NSSRAACSGSRARVPSERTHTRPYSVSSPPTRRRIRSLPALLDEGAHEGLGVRFQDLVDLVEEIVGRLGGGEGLAAGGGVLPDGLVLAGPGGVDRLLAHGWLLVSVSGRRRRAGGGGGRWGHRLLGRGRALRTRPPIPARDPPGAGGDRSPRWTRSARPSRPRAPRRGDGRSAARAGGRGWRWAGW